LQDAVKLGVLGGSLLSALTGAVVLLAAAKRPTRS
jgi:Na+/H+ antiporter NhaA